LPLSHSVARELLAIAEPQPKHLNFASSMRPAASTLIWSCITSPHSGAPTTPTPMSLRSLTSAVVPKEPTFRGFSYGAMTLGPYAIAHLKTDKSEKCSVLDRSCQCLVPNAQCL